MAEQQEFGQNRAEGEVETEALGGCMARLAWLVVAPIALAFLGVTIAKNGSGPLGIESAVYWLIVVAAVTIRYFDVARLGGQNLSGEPASRRDFRRYALGLPAIALAGWLAAAWLA